MELTTPSRRPWARRLGIVLIWIGTAFLGGATGARAGVGAPSLVVQLSHAQRLSAMALSADGRVLASAAWDGSLRLWDARSAQELRGLSGQQGVVLAAALSADGRYLLTGGQDRTARLWDTRTGRELLRLDGHEGAVTAVAISPDASLLLTGGEDRTVRLWGRPGGAQRRVLGGQASRINGLAFLPDGRRALSASHDHAQLWDLESGRLLRTLEGHAGGVGAVAVSPDGRLAATGSLDQTARLWRLDTGEEIRRLRGHDGAVPSVAFAADGRLLATGGQDHTVRIWEVASGAEVGRLTGPRHAVTALAFSPDGRGLYSASGRAARRWSRETGAETLRFAGNSDLVGALAVSHDGRSLAIGSYDDTIRLWDTTTGGQARRLVGHTGDIRGLAFSPDRRTIASASRDHSVRLWDATSGRELHRFEGHTAGVRPVAYSPDGRRLASGGDDGTARLWQAVPTYRPLRVLAPNPGRVTSVAFSPDGRRVLLASGKGASLWDSETGVRIRGFEGHERVVHVARFSPDGRTVLTASWDRTARLWDTATGREHTERRMRGHTGQINEAAFSPDGRWIATGAEDSTARLWDAASGHEVRRYQGHAGGITALAWSSDGRYLLTGSRDQTSRLWDARTGAELARLVVFRDGDWAVVDSEGRYDAANGGEVAGLHWVRGDDAIALDQLKACCYDPGLLAKKLGHGSGPPRAVLGLARLALFPDVTVPPIEGPEGRLEIELANRGGGIGRVVVRINGKEARADARSPGADPRAERERVSLRIAGHPYLQPGKNTVEVLAYNQAGSLASRGVARAYWVDEQAPVERPTLWGIVAGISDYAGEGIDLRYAAKDARDMALALRLGASRLFGAERVHIRLLTSPGGPDASAATKAALSEAFEGLRAARTGDILVVYLAGHGVAAGDRYYYPTQEAGAAALTNPAIRSEVALSSAELVAWLRRSPALKQVMILDTCAAGSAASRLVEPRDVPSDQVRALERLKDRTGFHVLMGSAADAVSYEATAFEQGLLTHSLLEGMKGAALREAQFVDVSRLFQHSVDEVPRLAAEIGGIQRPRIAAPRGSSFDIGQLSEIERRAIPFHPPKPLLLQPVLQNAVELFDDLGLSARVRARLRAESYASARGRPSRLPAVYVNAEQLAGALRPSGSYTVQGGRVTVQLVLVRNGTRLARFRLEGPADDLDGLARGLVDRLSQAIRRLD